MISEALVYHCTYNWMQCRYNYSERITERGDTVDTSTVACETMPRIFSAFLPFHWECPGAVKKSSVSHLTPRMRSFFLSACTTCPWTFLDCWHVPRATAMQNFSCRMNDTCVFVRAGMCTCIRVWVACRFFSHYRSPGISPSTGGMLFLTGGGPRPRFFSLLSPLRASVFPVFFSLFYRCTHYPPFCFRIGILFIFHGPWPATLADYSPSPPPRVDAFSLN